MSSPAKSGPATAAAPAEKEKRLSKFVRRMKTVLKGESSASSSKRTSVAPQKAVAKPVETKAAVPAKPTGPVPTKIKRSEIDAERVRKLGEKFKVSIEPLLTTDKDKEALRVEKPIRMRIHRTCHKCNTTFGSNKVCAKCEHVKCKQCPRYPPKKTDKGKSAPKGTGIIEPDTYYGIREQIKLTKPSNKVGGQPLVRKKVTQRVRRTCCQCSTLYNGTSKDCASCHHVRCADCPRDPAKKKKYPDGYPGDAPSSNINLPVKYACHKCSKVFPPRPNPASAEGLALKASGVEPPNCVRCKHPLCPECPRAPPTKVEPAPDPEVLRSVQAKLAALDISHV